MNLMIEKARRPLDLSVDQQSRLRFGEKPAHSNATTWQQEELLGDNYYTLYWLR